MPYCLHQSCGASCHAQLYVEQTGAVVRKVTATDVLVCSPLTPGLPPPSLLSRYIVLSLILPLLVRVLWQLKLHTVSNFGIYIKLCRHVVKLVPG